MSFFHCYEIPLSCLESSSRTARGYPGCQRLFLRDYLVDLLLSSRAESLSRAVPLVWLEYPARTNKIIWYPGWLTHAFVSCTTLKSTSLQMRTLYSLWWCLDMVLNYPLYWCTLFLAEFYPKDIHLSQDEWKWPFFVLLSLRGRRRRGEGRRNLPSPSPFGTGRVG